MTETGQAKHQAIINKLDEDGLNLLMHNRCDNLPRRAWPTHRFQALVAALLLAGANERDCHEILMNEDHAGGLFYRQLVANSRRAGRAELRATRTWALQIILSELARRELELDVPMSPVGDINIGEGDDD